MKKLKIKNLKTVAYPIEDFKQSFCFAVKKCGAKVYIYTSYVGFQDVFY